MLEFFNFQTREGRLRFAALLVGFGVLVFALFKWLSPQRVASFQIKPALVEVAVTKEGPISRVYNTNGVLAAVKKVSLFPEIEGRVSEILFKEGSAVKKGQVLMRMDDRLLEAQFNEAKARLNLAKSEYERSKSLYEKKFVARAVFDEKKSKFEIAKAEVDIAKIRLDQAKIIAPFAGVIGLKDVSEGATVNRSKEIATLLVLDPLYVDFSVPESLLKYLSSETIVDVTVDGFDVLPMEGKIDAVDSKANPGTHSIQVRATISNVQGQMRPGQFARVALNLGQEDKALLIPIQALLQEGDSFYVYTVIDKTAVRKEVQLGLRESGMVHVKDGLKPGDQVVVVGQINIQDGMAVQVKQLALQK